MGVIEARRAPTAGTGNPSPADDVEASAEHLFMQAMAGSMALDHLGDLFFLFCEHGRGRKIKAGLTDTVVSVRATSKKQRRSLSTKGWLAMLSRVPRRCPIVPGCVPVRQARSIFARNVAFSAHADQMGELRFPHFIEALVDIAGLAFPAADDFTSVRTLVHEALVPLYEMEMGTAPVMMELDEDGLAARPDITASASAQRGPGASPSRGSGASVASSSAFVAARTSELVLTSQGTMSAHRARQLGLAAMPTRTRSIVHPGGAPAHGGTSVVGDSICGHQATEASSGPGARVGLSGHAATLGRRSFSMRGLAMQQAQQASGSTSEHGSPPTAAADGGPVPALPEPDTSATGDISERWAGAAASDADTDTSAGPGEGHHSDSAHVGRKRFAVKSLDLGVEGGSARLQSTSSPGVALSPAGQRASVSLRGGALSAPSSPSGRKLHGDFPAGSSSDGAAQAGPAAPSGSFFASAMGKRGRSPFQRQQTPAPGNFGRDLAEVEEQEAAREAAREGAGQTSPTDRSLGRSALPPPPPPPAPQGGGDAPTGAGGSPSSSSSSQSGRGSSHGGAETSGSASPSSGRGAVAPGRTPPPAPPPRHSDEEGPMTPPLTPAEHEDGAGPLVTPAVRRAQRGSVHSPQALAASSIHTAVVAALEGGALDTSKPGGRELLGALKQMLGALSQAAQANRELRVRVEELVLRVTQLRHATMEAAADS